jgi:uncharacterized protein
MDNLAAEEPMLAAASEPARQEQAIRNTSPAESPTPREERIPVLDAIRGMALLGILLMNIPAFSGPDGLENNPTLVGHHDRLNIGFWFVRIVFFEGKMRAAFSMLFGAGVILLTERAEARGLGARVGDIFTRRNMCLVVFGMLHAYFLWFGDILYWYGMMALIFLYPFRRAAPRLLLISGGIALVLAEVSGLMPLAEELPKAQLEAAAAAAQRSGKRLTQEQAEALKNKAKVDEQEKKDRAEELKHMRGGYFEIVTFRAPLVKYLETDYLYYLGFADALGMMLIGMALLRIGFLQGNRPTRVYVLAALVGYSLSLAILSFGAWKAIESHFTDLAMLLYIQPAYQLVRLAGAVANLSVMILLCRLRPFDWITGRLAAVGQTALSNYILTSVLCSILFNGYGFGLYGRLEYYQLFYVVATVWAVNLILSPIWLRHFHYGPLEWVWRSLTYWKRQPMRLGPSPGNSLASSTA